MSAVSLAVVPTVSLRSSRWITPSTRPSISISSVPVISPFTCRLDPSHALGQSAVASNGRIPSRLFLSRFFLPNLRPSLGQHNPHGFSEGGDQNPFPAPGHRN